MKFSRAIDAFLLVRKLDLSPNTAEIYHWALTHMCQYLGDPEVATITHQQLLEFFAYLVDEYQPNRSGKKNTQPLAPRSIENIWTAMRSFFNWAIVDLKLKKRPDDDIPRPKYRERLISPFTNKEIVAIFKACEYTTEARPKDRRAFVMKRHTALRDIAVVSLLLDTGVRASECCRLNVGDVNVDTGEVFVAVWGTGVKSKGRTVALGKAARKAILRYLLARDEPAPDEPLFVTSSGGRLDRTVLQHLVGRIGDRAGIKDCHPHRFRHTMAIFYLRNGGNVFSLQAILGHETLEMVHKYIKLSQSDVVNDHRQASPLDRLLKR